MMHYAKGENIEQELTKEDLPFSDCMPKEHKDFLWMHVKGGTKLSNVINYAKAALEKGEYRSVVWSGVGGGVVKTVSCAEVIKRSLPLYQVTRIQYVTNEEHWVPQMQGLEEIVAKRQIPSIHILMSLDPIDDSIEGLQKPGTTTDYYHDASATKKGNQQQQQQPRQHGQQREGGPNVRGGRSNPSNRPPKRNNDNNRPQRPDQKPSDNAEQGEKTTSQKLPTQAGSSEQSAQLDQGSSNNPENTNQEQAKRKRNRNRKKKPAQSGESAGDGAQHKERREEAKQEANKSACSSKSVENMES